MSEAIADAHVPAPMPADLDVVVLGGAGHVGLPLSLVLADSGARVGIFDIDGPRLERLKAMLCRLACTISRATSPARTADPDSRS